MEWFYADNGKRVGPVSEAEFEALVRRGTIQPGTLVWQAGLSQWQPYQAVARAARQASAPGPRQVVCAECGKAFAETDVIT